MFFLDKLVIAAVSPLGTALGLAALALWLAGRQRRSGAWRLGALALAWLALWSLPVASHGLRGWLEADHRPQPLSALPKAQAMVVLGGTLRPPGPDGSPANLGEAVDRLWLAAQLYHAGKAPLVLLSGGSSPQHSSAPEAQAMQAVLASLGVPLAAMVLEERSRNTRENARFSAAVLLPQGRARVLLVTSALHMPRAVALFEAQGFAVLPAATDHTGRSPPGALGWLPDAGALEGSGSALKELVARWAGR